MLSMTSLLISRNDHPCEHLYSWNQKLRLDVRDRRIQRSLAQFRYSNRGCGRAYLCLVGLCVSWAWLKTCISSQPAFFIHIGERLTICLRFKSPPFIPVVRDWMWSGKLYRHLQRKLAKRARHEDRLRTEGRGSFDFLSKKQATMHCCQVPAGAWHLASIFTARYVICCHILTYTANCGSWVPLNKKDL